MSNGGEECTIGGIHRYRGYLSLELMFVLAILKNHYDFFMDNIILTMYNIMLNIYPCVRRCLRTLFG